MMGMLFPGDQPATLEFTATIDIATAQNLNAGREILEDILILRLENGRDYYISIKAEFARSCFGMSIDDLVMYSEPIRNIPLDTVERSKVLNSALCVPKELWRLVDAINEKGLYTPNLFFSPGVPAEIESIRESLDTGANFAPCSIHSYAATMVQFLTTLGSPIIPPALYPVGEVDSQTIQASSRRLLEELPPIHYNTFVYMISFFRETLMRREQNGLNATKLARVCCSCMAPGTEQSSKKQGMQLILLHLLETNSI